MKIVKLTAENVKRLRAVEITPDGNTVVIAGRNAQGKSSVLDAIWMALAGGAGAKETSRPIRDGETKASVVLDLGDLVVTRKWTQAGTTLEVAAQDGARYGSPQTILDGLIGRLSFDPLAFAEQDAKHQLQMLLDVVELPFDPVELDARRRGVFEKRTDVNREVKRVEAQLAGLPPAFGDVPDEEISAVAVAEELRQAEDARRRRDMLQERVTFAKADVVRAREALQQADEAHAALVVEFTALPDPIDVEPLRAQLASVDATNAAVRVEQERKRLTVELETQQKLSARSTKELAAIDKEKADAIAAAKMPLEGLSFDEDGVLYQGVPFSQASSAERLRVGLAIAMAMNPKIRVIRITDGSLLDSENLALIEEMAGEHDFQCWIERVDESGSVGITIEDGQVAVKPVELVESAA